jgi:uncharacterized protein with PIN domain
MKRLIISKLNSNPYDTGLNKIIEQWESGQSIIVVPPEYVVEVVEDGRNEAAIWLDQEIEKRKAAVEEFCDNLNEDYDEADQFVCSECDIRLEDWKRVDYDEGEKEYFSYELKYCPNCGRKIRSTQ